MYLHDTQIIEDQHCEALRASSKEVMDLINALPAKIIRLRSMSDGTGDAYDMVVYHDDIDKKFDNIYIYICNNTNSIY
jgi:hypothetical protein